jgi:hypothetical protein
MDVTALIFPSPFVFQNPGQGEFIRCWSLAMPLMKCRKCDRVFGFATHMMEQGDPTCPLCGVSIAPLPVSPERRRTSFEILVHRLRSKS